VISLSQIAHFKVIASPSVVGSAVGVSSAGVVAAGLFASVPAFLELQPVKSAASIAVASKTDNSFFFIKSYPPYTL